jgi:hypothetical protein
LAGFEVSLNGRFWVSPDVLGVLPCFGLGLGLLLASFALQSALGLLNGLFGFANGTDPARNARFLTLQDDRPFADLAGLRQGTQFGEQSNPPTVWPVGDKTPWVHPHYYIGPVLVNKFDARRRPIAGIAEN